MANSIVTDRYRAYDDAALSIWRFPSLTVVTSG